MSQPNSRHPQFQYTIHHAPDQYPYDVHVSQANSRNWQSQLPSGQRNIQSTSVSVRSPIADSSRRSFDLASSQQASISPIDSRIDPSLFLNTLNPSHGIRANYESIGQNYREEESWNAFNLRTVGEDQARPDPLHSSFKSYRAGPGSIGSIAPISDSGFYSQSVLSNEPGRFNQDLPPSITSQVDNMHVSLGPREPSELGRVPSDQRSHASSRSGRQDKYIPCLEPDCSESLKCKSDFKKHMLKHKKPFLCEEPGCKRRGQGFTTVNDLDRHKKSVHRLGLLKKSYQCASELCRNKEKIWPRLDNFKQHIERMHREEDHVDLIRRSTYAPKIPQTIVENDVVAPMETILAGMDNSFSTNERYDLGVPTAIPDQDIGSWSSGMPMDDLQTQEPQPSIRVSHLSHRSGQPLSRLSQGRTKIRKPGTPGGSTQRELYGRSNMANEDAARQTKKPQLNRFTGLHNDIPQPRLSKEPQTKAQQQRQALQKLSKAVSLEQYDSPQEPVDLEQSILRILSTAGNGNGQQQSHGDASFLSKSEAIRAVQAISNLIKQSPGSAYSQPRRAQPGATADPKVCTICGYAVARACDLKKHMKRHEKPYGCTYPKCHKRFGAKSDWKRHENSQHFQLEAYRCRELDVEGRTCGEHCFRAAHFEKHLEEHHGMSEHERVNEIKERKIGKNCQGQFWCGFCVDVLRLKARKNAAWDERFDHIADHFQADERKIEEWVCAEENKTKQELLKEMDRYVFDDDDDDDRYGDAPGPPPGVPVDVSQSSVGVARPAPPMMQERTLNENGKRLTMNSPGPRWDVVKKSRTVVTEITSYCCQCQQQFTKVSKKCVDCPHETCSNCWSEAKEAVDS